MAQIISRDIKIVGASDPTIVHGSVIPITAGVGSIGSSGQSSVHVDGYDMKEWTQKIRDLEKIVTEQSEELNRIKQHLKDLNFLF